MSVDLSENESNVEMGGMDDEASSREKGKTTRRKRKTEDYDKDDDFIDDTELAWEQQALMAKDGFFVYSGPLVTEDKPAVERYVSCVHHDDPVLTNVGLMVPCDVDEDVVAAAQHVAKHPAGVEDEAVDLAPVVARPSASLVLLRLTDC